MVKGVPFNGTGHSGMGAYHGIWGFREFTHPSSVLFGHTHIKAHIESIRKHVKELARKDYASYVQPPKMSAGYVIMFVPNMGALWTALNAEPDLWRWAAEQNVYIADEQSLYGAIRIVQLTWTQVQQAENHQKVYALAGEMMDRVDKFLSSYEAVGKALENAQKAYGEAGKKLAPGGQSITTTAIKLAKMGARKGKQIERALLKGARIDKIGFQFHMFRRAEEELEAAREFYDPERIYAVMDTYARFNKPIQITEVTIPAYSGAAEDEGLQREILFNLYRMWFSHPAVEAIVYWNAIDGFAFGAVPGDMTAGENYYYGGLLRFDFTPKPAYEMIRDLFKKEYRTELEFDAPGGEAVFKGFYGDYELEIISGDRKVRQDLRLSKGLNNRFTVKL